MKPGVSICCQWSVYEAVKDSKPKTMKFNFPKIKHQTVYHIYNIIITSQILYTHICIIYILSLLLLLLVVVVVVVVVVVIISIIIIITIIIIIYIYVYIYYNSIIIIYIYI